MPDVIKTSTYKNVVFANNDAVADHIVVERLFQNGIFKNMKVYSLDGKTGAKTRIAARINRSEIRQLGFFKAIPVMDLFKDDGVGFNKEFARFEISAKPNGELYLNVALDEKANKIARNAVKSASQRLSPRTMENFFDNKDQLRRGSLQSRFDSEFFNSNVNNSGSSEDPAFYSKSGSGRNATYGISYPLTPDSVTSRTTK